MLCGLAQALQGTAVRTVACGYSHSLVLSKEGAAFSFGSGEKGRLGHGDEDDAFVPRMIEALAGEHLCAAACGYSHSLVLREDGAVFSFGQGQDGRLGHGNDENVLRPQQIEALRGVRVCAVAAGGVHSLVLSEEGAAFSFGQGKYGRLGHGDQANWGVPRPITMLRGVRVCAVAAGDNHTLVRSRWCANHTIQHALV